MYFPSKPKSARAHVMTSMPLSAVPSDQTWQKHRTYYVIVFHLPMHCCASDHSCLHHTHLEPGHHTSHLPTNLFAVDGEVPMYHSSTHTPLPPFTIHNKIIILTQVILWSMQHVSKNLGSMNPMNKESILLPDAASPTHLPGRHRQKAFTC